MVQRCRVNFQCRGVLLIWMMVGQEPIALAVGADGGGLYSHPSFLLFLSLWETARYRLKYRLKGPLNPKQPANQNLLDVLLKHIELAELQRCILFESQSCCG